MRPILTLTSATAAGFAAARFSLASVTLASVTLASLALASVTLASLALAPAALGQGTSSPNASQLIQQLTPGPQMTTRGIRFGGQAPAPGHAAAPGHPVTQVSAGASQGQANLNVPFATGSSAISPIAARVLDQLGQALTSPNLAQFKFRVEGHTDTVGTPDSNKELSEQRANSVADYLASKFSIDRARLTPVGMGEQGLLVATGPGVPEAANRRVLVVNLGN